jgi:ectoine hydroxylase-related dioxygenase (phytanoyl-CoA dioxygenase family)
LNQAQRHAFFEHGYIHLPAFISKDWVQRLKAALDDVIERSRRISESDRDFVLAPGHISSSPRLRRLNYAADNHPTFWNFAAHSPLVDLVADLVGPNVKFRESMVNFKWARGGDEVKWHQDTSYLYTNSSPVIALTSFEEVAEEQGPLLVVPGSHKGPVFRRFDESGRWTGAITERDLNSVPLDKAVMLTGPPGSVTVLHTYVVHGSRKNESERSRPLFICGYEAADAMPYRPLPMTSRYTGQIVRGEESKIAHLEEARVPLPPDWAKLGYTSLYEHQQRVDRGAAKPPTQQ